MARHKTVANRSELIIEAAEELFARYGYERTSIDDIAKHLNIGKGSVYLDFRTKDEILFEILRRYATSIQDLFEARLEGVTGSPLQGLQDALEESVLTVYDRVNRDFHTPEALLHTSVQMKSRYKQFFIRKRELITGFLRKAANAGEISSEIANEETALLIMLGTATIFPPYMMNCTEVEKPYERAALEKMSHRLLTVLLNGLRYSK